MAKFEIGAKVVVVDAGSVYYAYKNGDTGVVVAYDVCPDSAGYVRREDGELINVYWSEVELIEGEKDSKGAESLRNSILDIRSKREALQKEILLLDEQEKEAVEKLKELGFVLYEDNVSKEAVITEKKDVLYAEDIEEDMTDYRNWEVGDKILCKNWIGGGTTFITGDLCKMIGFEDGKWPKLLAPNGYSAGTALTKNFKFHSRPVK